MLWGQSIPVSTVCTSQNTFKEFWTVLDETCFFIIPQITWDFNCQNKLTKAWFVFLPSFLFASSFPLSAHSLSFFQSLFWQRTTTDKSKVRVIQILYLGNLSEQIIPSRSWGFLERWQDWMNTFQYGFTSLWYNLSLNFQCGCQNTLKLLSPLKRFWFCELT